MLKCSNVIFTTITSVLVKKETWQLVMMSTRNKTKTDTPTDEFELSVIKCLKNVLSVDFIKQCLSEAVTDELSSLKNDVKHLTFLVKEQSNIINQQTIIIDNLNNKLNTQNNLKNAVGTKNPNLPSNKNSNTVNKNTEETMASQNFDNIKSQASVDNDGSKPSQASANSDRRKPVKRTELKIGTGKDETNSSVPSFCGVERMQCLFVGQVDPGTKASDVQDYVINKFGINAKDVTCQILANREEYCSFKVGTRLSAFPQLLNVDKWPKGVAIKEFENIPRKRKTASFLTKTNQNPTE